MTEVQEARKREESFIGNLADAQDDYEWIVEHRAWKTLGWDTFAEWWTDRVTPIMRALSMRPTREIAARVVEQVRQEEAALPPAQRRTQRELAELAGVDRSGLANRDGSRSVQRENAHQPDLGTDPDPLPAPVAAEIERRITAKTTPRREPVMLTLRTHTGQDVPYPKPQSRPTFNETPSDGISWAAWSWNPVTGCLHGCNYCYARAIIHRYPDANPAGFTPLFHEERLDAPTNTTIPERHRDNPAYRRVFVCSMADLYGRWVPDEWIGRVHESMLAAPHWQYILLTKFPGHYAGLDIPPNAWVGTSVDEQKRVRIAQDAMAKLDGGMVKWLSLEPLREPLEFDDLSMFDWVVIGAQTETYQPDGTVPAFAPPFEWVASLVAQARAAGCKVHLKPNLVNGRPGMALPDEYPTT